MVLSRVGRSAVAASLLAAAACSEVGEPTRPDPDPSPNVPQSIPEVDPNDVNSPLRRMPGYGGFFINSAGVPTLLLTAAANRPAVEQAIGPLLRTLDVGPQLQVMRADYETQELEDWFQTLSPDLLAEDGVVFVDNDEERNRVTVGVENMGVASRLRTVTARRGVPEVAIHYEVTEPIVEAVSLRDRVRPVVGGLQLNFLGTGGSFLCTHGVNVLNPPDTRRSFLTNSHCTRTRGSIAAPGTIYAQNLLGPAANVIGSEVEDPPFFGFPFLGCPILRVCRRSDAARAVYNSTTSATIARIERTTTTNSLTIAGLWNIVGEGVPVVGMILQKTGRTTGWTQGQVSATCVNTNVSGGNITMICQDFVARIPPNLMPIVGAGDSGSPVFSRNSPFNVNVVLRGLLWGSSGAALYVFSRLSLIEAEMGPMTTF